MLVFSPSVHEAISHMRFATSVRILDDRPPPGMHRPSCLLTPEWRHIRADVYPADGCMLNHGMTVNYDNVHLLHPHKFKHSPKPTELLARSRLSNADASRHWVHGESVDGYAYPLPQSKTKKRKRATIFTDGCELKTVQEIRQSGLQRASRLRTQAPKNMYDDEPSFCAMYAPEAWYCRDPRLMAREPGGIEREVPGFVFATPAISLNDIDKYADSVNEDVIDSLVYALDKLSLDDYVPPVFDEAQAFLEDVFSTMLQLGDSGQANDIPDEPIDIPFYEPTIFNSVDEPHGMDAMPTVIIEISDDESDDGDDSSEEVQADDGNGNGDAGSGEEGDSVDEDDLEGVNYYANLLSSPTPLSRDPTASILASLILWGIGEDS